MSRLPLAITTTSKFDDAEVARARAGAARLGLPFVKRGWKAPLAEMLESIADAFLVYDSEGVILRDREGELRFTPGMAHLRVKRISAGAEDDFLLRFTELRPGDALLDCTLGLGSDALVAARAVGAQGKVVGLEKSVALHAVVSEGLSRHPYAEGSCQIEALRADAAAYLKACPARSFDVVFFDPMFERPRRASPTFEVLRRYADYSPLDLGMLQEARRVARRWVVIKGSRYSQDLKKLGLRPEAPPRHATVVWARVEAAP